MPVVEEKIKPRKALGQNFLVDQSILKKIISHADLNKEDVVVEIGAGMGDLTQFLVQQSKVVVALELDQRLIDILENRFRQIDNVSIVGEDALKFDYQQVSKKYHTRLKVVGNIPYYLSTALTTKLLKMRSIISLILFMFQKEVAERIIAKPGFKTYGPLSILSQNYSDVSKVMDIKRSHFFPQPKVDSSLVKFVIYQNPKIGIEDEENFEKTLHSIFAHRRKILLNSLMSLGGKSKEEMIEICKSAGIDYMRRSETLTLKEIEVLFKNLKADR
jgi:16S rRNA (adenine1518-N6/adenine1519-N6)-dimethyltransferase